MKKIGQICFVVGTGTDVGKTVLAAGLLRAAQTARLHVRAVKAVQTGCVASPDGGLVAPDLAVYEDACPKIDGLALECFTEPCSPHLASALEGRRLDVATLEERIRPLAENVDLTVVEGAGGVLVPLNDRETVLDLVARLVPRVVVAASNSLGSINHTLLTIEALRARGLRVEAVVMFEVTPDNGDERRIRADNPASVTAFGQVDCLVTIPHFPGLSSRKSVERQAVWERIARRLKPVVRRLAALPSESGAGADIVSFDESHLWHPYARTHPPARCRVASRTFANRIRLSDGRELVDGMSSWWAAIHGYNHPDLLAALRDQARAMPHIMFGSLTHEPAARLGRKLLEMLPVGLERLFFVDSGSVAVEAALKMALQYQRAVGHIEKIRIATALGGYHGDTLGAMSVCDPENGMHRLFPGVLPEQVFVERPKSRFGADFDPDEMRATEKAFDRYGAELAAFIIEPVVQGGGGMWFYHPEYLRRIRRLCTKHEVLLIFDEIATGFGRTGTMWAGEWAGTVPDLMCVGKALTGGVMTLAAVAARDGLARAISREGVLMHGPTFTANPLACAVAAASLDLLAKTSWRERVACLEGWLREGLEPCRGMPNVADVRVLGAIGVVEMTAPVNVDRLQDFFVDKAGVWLRPFSRLIYCMPPYATGEEDARRLVGAMRDAVEAGAWQ